MMTRAVLNNELEIHIALLRLGPTTTVIYARLRHVASSDIPLLKTHSPPFLTWGRPINATSDILPIRGAVRAAVGTRVGS